MSGAPVPRFDADGGAGRVDRGGPRRACFVLKDLGGGGAERMTARLASGAARHGHDVELVLFRHEGVWLAELDPAVRVVDLRGGRASRSIWRLSRHLRERRPDAVFTTLRHTAMAVAVAHRLAASRARLIVREANHLPADGGFGASRTAFAARGLLRWSLRRADLVTAVSSGVTADVERFVRPTTVPVVTRYNPVIDRAFREAAKLPARHRWLAPGPRAIPTVVTAGRLTPQKDYPTLLAAMALVRRQRDVRLVVFGDGPERAPLRDLARRLGIGEALDMPGFEPAWIPELAAADLFVSSSRWEGMPGVLVQALACGVPIVSTDCPSGPSEILEGGRWGRLVPVADAASLAAGILAALEGDVARPAPSAAERFEAERAVEQCIADLFGAPA